MIHIGNCLDVLPTLEAGSVNTCVTSPPYFGLRDYGVEGQIGLEATPDEFVEAMVAVFREVRRVLRDDGTLWVNLGDSYARDARKGGSGFGGKNQAYLGDNYARARSDTPAGMKQKDLMGIPWMVAFALRADGWYLRQDIIWSKPNPMPESVTDRCTKSHEYIFLLSKGPKYYFDQEAIKEPASLGTHKRMSQDLERQVGSMRANGGSDRPMKAGGRSAATVSDYQRNNTTQRKYDPGAGNKNNPGFDAAMAVMPESRNKRSVWEVTTKGFSEAHFATYPEKLIEPCVLAGSPKDGLVLDPFMGAGTTAVVATRLGRKYVGSELNPDYAEIARARLAGTSRGLGF